MNAPAAPLAVLKTALIQAKLAEEHAKAARLEIEESILAHFPTQLEGTVTNEGIAVNFKLTRTVDTAALQEAWASLGTNAQKAFKWKADVDLKHFRAIQELDPASYKTLIDFVTTKPAKPSIIVKDF